MNPDPSDLQAVEALERPARWVVSDRNTAAEQQAIVTAACAWAGAVRGLGDAHHRGATDAQMASGQAHVDLVAGRLLAAVDAYLGPEGDQ